MSVACIMYAWSLAWKLRQKPLAVRRGLLTTLPAEAVRVSMIGHQGSQYLLHGKRIYQYSELAAWH